MAHAKSGGGGDGAAWRSSASATARQLFWRVRSTWRNAVLRPRRGAAAAARFGYDIESYSRNFDDGLDDAHRFCS